VQTKIHLLACVSLISACAAVSNETRTTAVIEDGFYQGTEYQIRTQLIEGPEGSYERTSVVYRGVSRTCILDSPGDCESKAERLIEECDESFFCV
jgi:hypothetical protein